MKKKGWNRKNWPGAKRAIERRRCLPGEKPGLLKTIAIRNQVEVAAMLGISHQAVNNIERNALWKIRRMLEPLRKELAA